MQGTYIQVGREIDYTPSTAVVAGQVVVQGPLVGIAKVAIAASKLGSLAVSGIFDVDQNAEIITAGAAVYWDADGTSVSGTAGEGAATATATGNTFMGFAQTLTAATDSYVRIALRSAEVTAATVATATSITGTASTLPIAGLASTTGGSVSVTGGASSTSGTAGATASLVGGVGGATGAGGAALVTGGVSGATSGVGGAATITGGAAGSSAGNAIGGAASLTGGIGKGSSAGGAASVVGGLAGATGVGGAIAIAGGAGGLTSGAGGAVVVAGGSGTTNSDGGAVSIRGGALHGSGANGVLNLGVTNTSAINLGATDILTVCAGPVQHRATAAVTATVGGATTGLIPAGTQLAIVTSDNADKQISLPAASVGDEIELLVTGAACELISVVAGHKVNEVAVGATNECALTQDSLYRCKYVATNKWIVTGLTKLGAVQTALVPDAL